MNYFDSRLCKGPTRKLTKWTLDKNFSFILKDDKKKGKEEGNNKWVGRTFVLPVAEPSAERYNSNPPRLGKRNGQKKMPASAHVRRLHSVQ